MRGGMWGGVGWTGADHVTVSLSVHYSIGPVRVDTARAPIYKSPPALALVMAAPNTCCVSACLPTHDHPHDPRGAFHTLGPAAFPNVETYVTLPPGLTSLEDAKEKKWDKIILWMADVYGPRYMNNQEVMDLTAAQGRCTVGNRALTV